MLKFSEKRTYCYNGEMIFITKVRKDKDQNFYHVTFENIDTKELKTVKDSELSSAVKTIDSTEFFMMYCHFNNFKHRDAEYTVRHCNSVLKILDERKIELTGSNKFEEYDLKHLEEMCNYVA